jgi:hypothetical protein
MEGKKSCPSAPFKEGHSVFGIFKDDRLEFTDNLIKIDQQMVEDSFKTEFRVSMKCVTKGCVNWNGKKCSVPDQMSYFLSPQADPSLYEKCSLKPTCRWFAENGAEACKMCPLIRTKFVGT